MLQESSSELATLMEDNDKLRAIRAQQAERESYVLWRDKAYDGMRNELELQMELPFLYTTPSATPARFAFHHTLATACAFWDSFSERAEGHES